jgi:hypothetical protein
MKGLADAIVSLQLTMPGFETPKDLVFMYTPLVYGSNTPVLLLSSMWLVSFLLYVVDTQLWFVVGCSFLGVIVYFAQRGCRVATVIFEDAVAKIPERFSKHVLKYTKTSEELKARSRKKAISEWFPHVWDRIVEYMRYEDDLDYEQMGELSYASRQQCESVTWQNLTRPLQKAMGQEWSAEIAYTENYALGIRQALGRDLKPTDTLKSRNGTLTALELSVLEGNALQRLFPIRVKKDVVAGTPTCHVSGAALCKNGCGHRVQNGRDMSGKAFDTCCRTCAMNPGHRIRHDRDCGGRQTQGSAHLRPNMPGAALGVAMSPSAPGSSVAGSSPSFPSGRAGRLGLKLPDIFREKHPSEIFLEHYGCAPESSWPNNADVQWRNSCTQPQLANASSFPSSFHTRPHRAYPALWRINSA